MENTKSQIKLQISGRLLLMNGEYPECNTYCIVLKPSSFGIWNEISRTEVRENSAVCTWSTDIMLEYIFYICQPVRFEVYAKHSRSRDELLAYLDITISELITEGGFRPAASTRPDLECYIMVNYAELRPVEDTVEFRFSARNLDKKSMLTKNSPYFRLYKYEKSGRWRCNYTSDYVAHTLNPDWAPFKLTLAQFCGSDLGSKVRVEVYDKSMFMKDNFIGMFEANADRIMAIGREFELLNPKKMSRDLYRNSGYFKVCNCELLRFCSFIDYIRNGTQLVLITAVDLGMDHVKRSSHKLRQAERLMWGLGNLIEPYSMDKKFDFVGFNSRNLMQSEISNTIFISSKLPQGLVRSYKEALKITSPSDQIKLCSVLDSIKQSIKFSRELDKFYTLLVIINGVIQDIEETSKKLLELSILPIGIIMVGLGSDSYTPLLPLYTFKSPPNSSQVSRTIARFIRYKDFDSSNCEVFESIGKLIPDLLMDYVSFLDSSKQLRKKGDLSRVSTSASEVM
jgi:hypothetical protein